MALRARIVAGEFPVGASLPSESTLCTEFRVARNTVRRALSELASEGLVASRRGRGRVVLGPTTDDLLPMPRYHAIASDLRALIRSGEIRAGDAVPSELALANRYAVARGTAQHALAELEGAGLIDAIHGKGRFVRRTDPATSECDDGR